MMKLMMKILKRAKKREVVSNFLPQGRQVILMMKILNRVMMTNKKKREVFFPQGRQDPMMKKKKKEVSPTWKAL